MQNHLQRSPRSRRLLAGRLLGGILGVLFCMVLPVVGSDESLPVVRVGFFPNITHAQALVAANMTREGKGWFESRLGPPTKIEWNIYNAGPSAMEAFFTKAIDLTYVGPSPAVNAHARSNGKEVRVIAGAMRGGEALVVRGEGISAPDDFRGKTISTPQLGNTQDVECRAWLIDHGIQVTLVGGDARVIPTANPDMLQLFTQEKLDAAWTVEPWVTRLINEANGRIFYADSHAVTTVLTARSGFLEENPDTARRFAAAHEELTAWMLANPDEARRRIRDELTAITRREIKQTLVDEAWPRLQPDTAISLEPFEKFLEKARKVGFLRARVKLDNLIWKP
ncbi:MAG: ABC transporter substrate-binding protein [Verrucomicrobiota bacterium]